MTDPTEAVERVHAALRAHGITPRPSGMGWKCRCPAHDDRNPSLSINVGDDGRALVRCHATCTQAEVVAALGLAMRDLMPDTPSKPYAGGRLTTTPSTPPQGPRAFVTPEDAVADLERRSGRVAAAWTYTDADRNPVGMTLRWDRHDGKRTLPISRNGVGWVVKAMPDPRPLYNLPDLIDSPEGSRVFVAEGEKAAKAALRCGLTATTSAGGAKAASKSDWAPLKGRAVVIMPDRDEPGERYAADVVRHAYAHGARSVRVVRLADAWPELPEGGDLADLTDAPDADLATIRDTVYALADEAAEEPPPAPRLRPGDPHLERLSDVEPEEVSWLWPGRIALGKLTMIAGDPGLGKSMLTVDLAARVSAGKPWPDRPDLPQEAGGVVLLNAEDAIGDTVLPRFIAAGGERCRAVAIKGVQTIDDNGPRMVDLSTDLIAIEKAIEAVAPCRLVVVDPITAFTGAVDSHKNAELRSMLAPLSTLADRLGVAVVAVSHLNKNAGGAAIYRTMGSLAFVAAARSAWVVAKHPDDPSRRVFVPAKNNIGPDQGGLGYTIRSTENGPGIIDWEREPIGMSADDALSGGRIEGGGGAVDEALEWLRDTLSGDPVPAAEIHARAKADCVSTASLKRAKAKLGVQSTRKGYASEGEWVWALPHSGSPPPKGDRPGG